jgi:hypothetical protein
MSSVEDFRLCGKARKNDESRYQAILPEERFRRMLAATSLNEPKEESQIPVI